MSSQANFIGPHRDRWWRFQSEFGHMRHMYSLVLTFTSPWSHKSNKITPRGGLGKKPSTCGDFPEWFGVHICATPQSTNLISWKLDNHKLEKASQSISGHVFCLHRMEWRCRADAKGDAELSTPGEDLSLLSTRKSWVTELSSTFHIMLLRHTSQRDHNPVGTQHLWIHSPFAPRLHQRKWAKLCGGSFMRTFNSPQKQLWPLDRIWRCLIG